MGREKRVKKYTNEREKKSSFFLEKKRKKRSQSSSLELFLKESLCLCVSFESKSEREKERVGWSRYVEGFDQSSALFYRGFPGESSWFRKRLKVKS